MARGWREGPGRESAKPQVTGPLRRRSRPEGGGEGCARITLRAERNVSRASAIDERDLQVLLHLLEHKILTTHQITSLLFRSLRRCQHRMRELKDLGLVSSFQVGRGFGEGRAPACWHLTKPGLVYIADAKDVRASDLPWVPDSSYRTNKLIAHRLGVNAFFCALAEATRALQGHFLHTWRPEHGVRTRSAEIKPDGFGRYLHRAAAASSTSSTTGPRRRAAR
jgi:Replication-relaxation